MPVTDTDRLWCLPGMTSPMYRPALCALVIFAVFQPLEAADDAGYGAVKALGTLNGVALHCRYFDQVSRMKAAVVETVPKERSYGLAFDSSTNESFLALMNRKGACPGTTVFSGQVDAAIAELTHAFEAR